MTEQPQRTESAMTEVETYRKKPVEIQAVRYDGRNRREVLSFIYPDMSGDGLHGAEVMALPVVIGTLEGDMTVSPGDWVIRGIKGEFYPCKPDIFEATYEVVEDGAKESGWITVHVGDREYPTGILVGHHDSAAEREAIAREVIKWAADFGDLEVTVYGPEAA